MRPPMKTITTLIADDEKIAREVVRDLLAKDREIEVVGEATDGEMALEMIRALKPQLVFLDIHMPIMTSLEALGELKAGERPEVIFVTAYDQHAMKAFDLHAVDYLVKPFSDERFAKSLLRAKRRLKGLVPSASSTTEVLDRLLATYARDAAAALPAQKVDAAPLVIKADGDHHLLNQRDIRWIESQGDYIKVHLRQRSLLTRTTLTGILDHLDPAKFVRIHKSYVVNVSFVRRLMPTTAWGRALELDDGTSLNISRSFRQAVDRII